MVVTEVDWFPWLFFNVVRWTDAVETCSLLVVVICRSAQSTHVHVYIWRLFAKHYWTNIVLIWSSECTSQHTGLIIFRISWVLVYLCFGWLSWFLPAVSWAHEVISLGHGYAWLSCILFIWLLCLNLGARPGHSKHFFHNCIIIAHSISIVNTIYSSLLANFLILEKLGWHWWIGLLVWYIWFLIRTVAIARCWFLIVKFTCKTSSLSWINHHFLVFVNGLARCHHINMI